MSLPPDTQLGHYIIRAQLGAGGMGEVYLAEDTQLRRKVAIKLLPACALADDQARKRLVREARAAAALDHPNICAVYEVREADGQAFIALQYVEGETLASLIGRQPLDVPTALALATQVADALAEAHAAGIVHRDIKPQNIMVTRRGQAKVMDFGLAKLAPSVTPADPQAETQSLLTTPGAIIGTVPYMSPEQVRGEPVDPRTDIFSFGAVLYEMITGHQPFAAKTMAEIISAILTGEPPPLASYAIAPPAALEQILRKCLEKDRERRYQTMREVEADLEIARRECERGALVVPTVDRAAPTIRVTDLTRGASLRARLTARRGLVLAVLIMLAMVASAYALFFRSPRSVPTAGGKSVNSAAYDYYLRGKVNTGSQNPENNESAIKLLEQAVAADPNFAPAYAELARAYFVKANYFAPEAERKKLFEDAEVAVEKALALNPDLAEAHLARGLLLWSHENHFPHEQAIQSYKRALASNPNLDEAHHQLGVIYLHIGLLDKAWAEIEKALAINPANNLARFRFGVIDMYRGKYEDALDVFKTIPREANPSLRDRQIATALFQLGRTQEASDIVEEYLHTYPTDEGGNVTSVKVMLLAKAGKEREAEETIQRAVEIGQGFGHFHHTAYNIASAYALMNKPEQALKWLQFAADDGFPCYPLFESDANLNSLRKDERFIAFMAKLKQQWERYNATL